jgi:integrase
VQKRKKKKKSLKKLTWDDILVKAAECGIRPNEFWEMTWKDFSIIVMGKERNEINEWARTRNLAYIVYLSNTTEKNPKSIKSFWHIPEIDDVNEEEERVMLTDEQLARTLKLYGVK